MFSGDPEYPGDVEKQNRHGYPDDASFIATYSLMLNAAKHNPGQPVAPEDVSGYVSWYQVKMTFDGVRGVRGERDERKSWSESSDGAVMESYWEVVMTEEQEDEEADFWLDTKGNAVGAAVVLDDNGFPFLVFDWHEWYHGEWCGYYLGKRLVEGKDWRLTDAERSRLGIGATFRSVEQLGKEGSPGVYPEDPEEEDDVCRGAGGSSGKKTVGKKRKASIDETSAKKRKTSTEETGAKMKATTEEAGVKKGKANTNETGGKKRRKRRRRRAHMVSWSVTFLLLLLSAEHLYTRRYFSTSSRPAFQDPLSEKDF